MKAKMLGLLAVGLFAVGPMTAVRADIIVFTGVNNQNTDNVLLNPATNVGTVTGTVGANDLLVNFTSSSGSGLLSANPSGQATISGGTGNDPMTQLTFSLANLDTFTRAVFNINADADGSVLLHVEGVNLGGAYFEQSFTVDANGQNFFTVDAINNQFMRLISLTAFSGATFGDVRQVRLGGGDITTDVPEPGSLALLGLGLLGLGMSRRRRAN